MSEFRDAVADLAAEFLAAMDDTCTVREPTAGRGAYNPGTKTYGGGGGTVYTGACLARPRGTQSTDHGERQIEIVDYDVILPATATGLAPDQQVTIDTTGTTSALLAGQTLTVLGVVADTFNARVILECKLNRGGGNAV